MQKKVINRKILLIACYIIFILLFTFIFQSHTQYAFAAELKSSGKEFGLKLSTNGALFQAENMAPGYTSSSSFSVLNDGKQDFSFKISTVLNNKDRMLYDGLIIEIKDSKGKVRFRDSMSHLDKGLELGTLAPDNKDNYVLTVYFPVECGNEYQGKTANVDFVVTALAYPRNKGGKQNCFDPPFSNSDYSMELGSTTPIKFECYDTDGNLITSSQNVKLVITGEKLGQGITYTRGNGLSFNGGHYQANVYTDGNQFTDGVTYTATIYNGSEIYSQKTFTIEPGNRSNAY